DIKVGKARHQGPQIEVVDFGFKQPDGQHLPVHPDPQVDFLRSLRGLRCAAHFETPPMRASTSNTTAKSSFSHPIPRAAVRNSLLNAVMGTGTFSFLASSMASSMSFCIMLTSNHASSGCSSTNGPRYWIMGEAMALCTMTSTATSRGM